MALITLGILISVFQQDLKMAGFQLAIGVILSLNKFRYKLPVIGVLLLIPSLAAIQYQKAIKDYPAFMDTLSNSLESTENQSPILTHNFIHFSREVLFLDDSLKQNLLLPIEKLDSLKPHLPTEFRVFLYDYYKHAYPKEQEDVDRLEQFLKENYKEVENSSEKHTSTRTFQKTY